MDMFFYIFIKLLLNHIQNKCLRSRATLIITTPNNKNKNSKYHESDIGIQDHLQLVNQ